MKLHYSILIASLIASCSGKTNNEDNRPDTLQEIKQDAAIIDHDTLPVDIEQSSEDEFSLLKEEQIGTFYIDMPADEVVRTAGEPDEKTSFEMSQADGLDHQTWKYSEGMEFDMYRENEDVRISSVTVFAPNPLTTMRGIKTGDSRDAVEKNYPEVITQNSDEIIVAGSVYGGIVFHLENEKVASIFLGASAE